MWEHVTTFNFKIKKYKESACYTIDRVEILYLFYLYIKVVIEIISNIVFISIYIEGTDVKGGMNIGWGK